MAGGSGRMGADGFVEVYESNLQLGLTRVLNPRGIEGDEEEKKALWR